MHDLLNSMCMLLTHTYSLQTKYWSNQKPIVPETGQKQSVHAMKTPNIPLSDSAYAMMGAASDTSVEAMMEGSPQENSMV